MQETPTDVKPKFLSKKEREELALQRLQEKREQEEKRLLESKKAHERFITGKAEEEKRLAEKKRIEEEAKERERRQKEENKETVEHDHELKQIREHYLGGQKKQNRLIKPSERFTKIFQFEWNATDDTGKDDLNPLYSKRMKINALFGRGYIAGVDHKEQRNNSNFLVALGEKRILESRNFENGDELTEEDKQNRERQRKRALEELKNSAVNDRKHSHRDDDGMGKHWTEKALQQMTERDWRIFREDFDIRIQGGRATLPLRYWTEANFPASIMKAINAFGYEKPSPIQRQAIPVGLSKRDIIGIAETGSGKTIAFLVPLLCYLLELPPEFFERCREDGPLAVVMAPTRELAIQIQEECSKLAQFTNIRSVCVVGGQSIDEQGFKLRKGVEIVIGTPGRMMDCLENNFMVLNQCNYVVLDEADKMIDMGFEPQVTTILESMNTLLKSEDEEQYEQQVQQLNNSAKAAETHKQFYRVTAMFSATMPTEVEVIAKRFLRHPVIVKIGDEDTGKNKRIEQRVFFVTEAQKKGQLMEELRRMDMKVCKIIVFINEKKKGDNLSYHLETLDYQVGTLHGGKSQDQREETLDMFRAGKIQILVATDVAGRGLDIPDVTHVFNYDVPNKISNYCHRIGRTGRAGKFGVATSFVTDADTEIMYDLRCYLESTDSAVPHQLQNHPAATAAPGTRDSKGKLLASKREGPMFVK